MHSTSQCCIYWLSLRPSFVKPMVPAVGFEPTTYPAETGGVALSINVLNAFPPLYDLIFLSLFLASTCDLNISV